MVSTRSGYVFYFLSSHYPLTLLRERLESGFEEGQAIKEATFSGKQVIGVLNEVEAGAKTPNLGRRHGVSSVTIYNWMAKYGGLEEAEARWLRELESENAKLKRLLADAMLTQATLKLLLARKLRRPLRSGKRSYISRRATGSARRGRIASSMPLTRAYVVFPSETTVVRRPRSCVCWPASVIGSAIAFCISCRAGRA